jgi:hypothetical protein
MSGILDRRTFMAGTAASGAALTLADASSAAAVQGANQRINVGVMGTGGRGTGLARAFQGQPNVNVTYVCDVDESRRNAAAQAVAKVSGQAAPQAVNDFRRILDDKAVDVLVVATCNHRHAPAAILACAAGKHVYVEKPCSYNPREGELLVQAARKHQKKVQMGNQRRSYAGVIRAIDELHKGVIGRVPPVPHQLPPLQLALVLALGQWRTRQQRHSYDRSVPLGPPSRLSNPRFLLRRPLPLRGRSADARHACRQL